MAYYRIQRKMPNGWNMRLDFISYDGSFSDTIENLPEVVLTEIGSLTAEFDSLPYGLMNPMTFGFNLIWDKLPATMQTRLENGYDEPTPGAYRRNTWYLYTDRGTNGATYTLEFVGCEDNIEALELQPLDNGMFSYNVELVDACYFWLKTITSADVWPGNTTSQPSEVNVWQIKLPGSDVEQLHLLGAIGLNGTFVKLEDLLDQFNNTSTGFTSRITHCSALGNNFDYGNKLKDIFTHAVSWYAPASISSLPRQADSTALTKDKIWVCSAIYPNNQFTAVGGLFSSQDKYGIANANTSAYDVLRDFCEQSAVRVGYRFTYTGSAGTTQIRVVFDVKTITEGRDASGSDESLALTSALTYSSITKRGDNILKAEVRFETESDKDATDIVKIERGARASRSYNIEPRLHNMPVHIADTNTETKWPLFKAPMKQTNQMYVRGNYYTGAVANPTNFIKLHEKTAIRYGLGGGESISVNVTSLEYPAGATDFPTNADKQASYYLKLNDSQVNSSLSAALCTLLLHVFADENNAIVEVDWPLKLSTKLMPDYVTGKYALTGGAATEFATINWSKAMPTSISVDLMAGKVTHRYFMVKV